MNQKKGLFVFKPIKSLPIACRETNSKTSLLRVPTQQNLSQTHMHIQHRQLLFLYQTSLNQTKHWNFEQERQQAALTPSADVVLSPSGSRTITRGATESYSRMYLATRRLHPLKGTSHRRLLLPGNARNFCGAGLTPPGHVWYCSPPRSKFIYFYNPEIRPPPREKQQTKIPYTVHWCPDKR